MRILLCLTITTLVSISSFAQSLTCPSSGSPQQMCSGYHYHLQMWRPDSKVPSDVLGVNRFATLTACETARTLEIQRNKGVIDFFRKLKPDGPEQVHRFGACHCDQTTDRNSPVYLDEAARIRQLRLYEEVNGRIRERLLDRGATNGSEVVRSLAITPPNVASTLWSKTVPPIPSESRATSATASEAELKNTEIGADSGARSVAAIDVPLATIDPKTISVRTTATVADDAADEESDEGAGPADAFIAHEFSRVDEISKAGLAVNDEALRTRIIDACIDRTQLLTNLRSIAEQAGPTSRLSSMMAAAKEEPSRIALATKLFGPTMQTHWAPADARNAIVEFPPETANDATAVVRDPADRYTDAQRRLALYYLLAKNPSLVANQQLWIAEIIDGFLAR
ncbi:MAG: hypothetical protein ACYC7A_00690 [Thermoanaerobaculia bacterium]